MRKFAIGAMLAFVLAAGVATGCSEAGQPVDEDMVKGFWQLDATAPIGMDAYLDLGGDGLAELYVADVVYEGAWAVDDGNAQVTWEDGQSTALAFTDGKLALGTTDGSKLVFVEGDRDAFLSEIGESEEGVEAEEGGEDPNEQPSEPVADQPEEGAEGEAAEADIAEDEAVDEVIDAIDPVVVADDATCTITVVGRGTDFTADPCYRLVFTNKTDRALFLTNEEMFAVAGREVDAGIGDSAGPGETVEATLYFPKDSLGGGLDLLVDVNGTLNVEDDDTLEEVASYPFHMG